MKIYDEIDRQPSRRELARFGFVIMLGFVVLGGVYQLAFDSIAVALYLWVTGCAVFALSLVRPLGRLLYIVWMGLGLTIGLVTLPIILAIVYLVLVVPVGLVFRLAGRDPMRRKPDPKAASYWEDYPSSPEPKRYVRQF